MKSREEYLEKWFANTEPEPNTGCWLFMGQVNHAGYPRAKYHSKKVVPIARVILGLTDPNLFVCHRCDTPACINPDHLFAGTNSDNWRDMWRKGRGQTRSSWAGRTHCINGHPITPENTGRTARGWNECLACRAARTVRQIAARRTAARKAA